MFQYVLSNFYIDILFPGGLSYGIAHLGNYTYEMWGKITYAHNRQGRQFQGRETEITTT